MALWKSLFKASDHKAQNGPSNQLIEATSCIETSNATIKAKELCFFSSYLKLLADKVVEVDQAAVKLIKKLMVMTIHSC